MSQGQRAFERIANHSRRTAAHKIVRIFVLASLGFALRNVWPRQRPGHRQLRRHPPRPSSDSSRHRRTRPGPQRRLHRTHLRSLAAKSPSPGVRAAAHLHQRAAHGMVQRRGPRSRRGPSLHTRSRASFTRRICRANFSPRFARESCFGWRRFPLRSPTSRRRENCFPRLAQNLVSKS